MAVEKRIIGMRENFLISNRLRTQSGSLLIFCETKIELFSIVHVVDGRYLGDLQRWGIFQKAQLKRIVANIYKSLERLSRLLSQSLKKPFHETVVCCYLGSLSLSVQTVISISKVVLFCLLTDDYGSLFVACYICIVSEDIDV